MANIRTNPNATVYACFAGYIVQAIVNSFVPLLFLTFESQYGIPLSQITFLITFNFGIQLMVDLLSARFVDKIGYRKAILLAHAMAAIGFIMLVLQPGTFAGIMCAVVIYAVGGGLLEVLISPIVEACPTDNKEAAMSLLHSFYCWGVVAVVAISTLVFNIVGIEHWKVMALLWAIVPIANGIVFLCGTALYAFMALAGDLGCSGGPTFAGLMADLFGGRLASGILCAIVFPALMLITLVPRRQRS